jgi:ABC-type branched-subunit amino acid transport system substrate-binding protein
MTNIRQNFVKFITSFVLIFFISACDPIQEFQNVHHHKGSEIVDVAILLPKSGPEATLGKEYGQMVKIGLSDGAKSKIRVTSYDSTDQEKLNQSLEKISESGADIIIGPIYTEPTKIVAEKLASKGKIIVSLSNNPALARNQVFVFGHAPMRQMEQLTNYLLDNGYKNYILLLPSNRRANLESKILSDIIAASGGTLDKVEFYGSSESDIAKSVQTVSAQVDALNENDQNLKQPVILVSDDPATLQILYTNAMKHHLDKKAIIAGDNQINIDSSLPLNITFTGALNNISQSLESRAKKAGINHISFMHAIAYDAGRMVGENIGTNYNKKKFLTNMHSVKEFDGISGRIHFIDSIAQRQYDIIKKENGGYHKISIEKAENKFNNSK